MFEFGISTFVSELPLSKGMNPYPLLDATKPAA